MYYNRDYNSTKFDPRTYLSDYYPSLSGNDIDAYFQLEQYHNFLKKYSSKWDKTSAKLLDFGAGAVISNVISAVPYVNEIVLAAHAEKEQKQLVLWKEGDKDAHDWSPFFKYIVNKLECSHVDEAWKERAALLRSRLTITSCDIYKESPIGSPSEELFSIITTNLCLEAACSTYDDYKMALKKLGKLLQLGGYLVMFVVERETFYKVGPNTFYCLYLTLAQIKQAMEEAGFDVLTAERDPAPIHQFQKPIFSDFSSTIFITGLKVHH